MPVAQLKRERSLSQRLRRFLPIQGTFYGDKSVTGLAHFALDFERKESVCGDHGH
jgi:hypothetical protein